MQVLNYFDIVFSKFHQSFINKPNTANEVRVLHFSFFISLSLFQKVCLSNLRQDFVTFLVKYRSIHQFLETVTEENHENRENILKMYQNCFYRFNDQ